jgi:uncharacterized protein (TIGR03089 family)
MTTFPDLLAGLLRSDPGRPLVTFYDDATGERVELSVATYANWVAKTASLLVDELDLARGDQILVDLPTHWLGPVFLGAAWTAGLTLVDESPDAVVCGPDGLDRWAPEAASLPVVACSLLPLGVRFADGVPAGVHDFGVEVWSQPDSFVPWDPPGPDDEAVRGTTQGALFSGRGTAVRLLTTANPVSPAGIATFVDPLLGGGSTVWVRHADAATWQRRYDEERATAQDGQPTRS